MERAADAVQAVWRRLADAHDQLVRPHGVRGELGAVEHQVGHRLAQRPVLQAGGLALGGVDDHDRSASRVRHRAQLSGHREGRPAAPAKARSLDARDQR